jgi:hypothetical protein
LDLSGAARGFFGVRRNGFFQRNLGIGRNVLAARL